MNNSGQDTFSQSIGALLLKLNEMIKKPALDMELNKTLDSYMEQLNKSQEYLTHGIFTMNFAEAGLFLESAAQLYGKKVDSLWDSTLQYQMELCSRSNSDEQNSKEAEKITQRMNRAKRKKALQQDTDTNNFLYEDLNGVCNSAQEFLNNRCDSLHVNQSQETTLDSASDRQVLNNQAAQGDNYRSISGFRFPITQQIFNLATSENICQYSDCYLDSAATYLETGECADWSTETFGDGESSMTSSRNDWLLQKYITERHLTYKQFWNRMLGKDFEEFKRANQHQHFTMEPNTSSLDARARSLCPKRFVVNLQRLPEELMSEYRNNSDEVHLKALIQNVLSTHRPDDIMFSAHATNGIKKCSERISNADSLFHDGAFNDSEVSAENCNAAFLTQRSMADSGICCSEGQGLSSLVGCSESVCIGDDLATNCDDAAVSRNLLTNHGANANILEDVGRNRCNQDSSSSRIVPPITVLHKSNLKPMEDIKSRRRRNLKRWFQEENPENRNTKRRKPYFRCRKITTTTARKFYKFYRRHYRPEFDEGCISEHDSDSDSDSDDELDTSQPFDSHLETSQEDYEIPAATREVDGIPSSSTDNLIDIPTNQHPVMLEERIVPVSDVATVNTSLSKSGVHEPGRLTAVSEWKSFIEPKLRTAGSSEFDIHKYGTCIMNSFPACKALKFKDLATGKSQAEVARLFVASLQLANTENISFGARSKGVANDRLELNLLSTERYHEHLEEYEAPSEFSYRERMNRVRAFQSGVNLHSTPVKCPSKVRHRGKTKK